MFAIRVVTFFFSLRNNENFQFWGRACKGLCSHHSHSHNKRKNLNKLKISNSSQICQRTEVAGQSSGLQTGGRGGCRGSQPYLGGGPQLGPALVGQSHCRQLSVGELKT